MRVYFAIIAIVSFEALIVCGIGMSWNEARHASFESGMAKLKIETLNTKVKKLEQNIEESKGKTVLLQSEVERYYTHLSYLDSKVYDYTGKIESLVNEVETLKAQKQTKAKRK